jgi:hypothetical protein
MKELRIVTQRLRTARQKRGPERWISQCDSQRLSLHCKHHRRHTGVVLRTCIGSTSCFAASASTAPSTASSADEGGGGALDGGDGLGGRIEEVGGGEDSAAAAVARALRFSATTVSESNMSCTAACASLTAVLMWASSSRQSPCSSPPCNAMYSLATAATPACTPFRKHIAWPTPKLELSASPSELLASPSESSQRRPAPLNVTQREVPASPSELS